MTWIGVSTLRQTTFNFSEGMCLPRLAVPRYTSVIQADATSSRSLRLLRVPEENTQAPLPHKPGNWNEKNREPVVVIVHGSEKQ